MSVFYRVLLFLTRFELQIARSTGRNPDHITALLNDEARWELAILDMEMNK